MQHSSSVPDTNLLAASSVSIRVQIENVFLNPDVEFWGTWLIANGDHTTKLDVLEGFIFGRNNGCLGINGHPGDGYEEITSTVLSHLSDPLLPSVSVQVMLCLGI